MKKPALTILFAAYCLGLATPLMVSAQAIPQAISLSRNETTEIWAVKGFSNQTEITTAQSFSELAITADTQTNRLDFEYSYLPVGSANWSAWRLTSLNRHSLEEGQDLSTTARLRNPLISGLIQFVEARGAQGLKLRSETKFKVDLKLFFQRDQQIAGTAKKLTANAVGDSFYMEDVRIVSRQGWGCKLDEDGANPSSPYYCDKPFWIARYSPSTHIVVHHTATQNENTDWPGQVRAIWRHHAKVRDANPDDGVQGWTDIGYNYLIDPTGVIYEGRFGGEGVTAGHAVGHNTGTVGVALLGTYTDRNISSQARASLSNLLKTLLARYGLDPTGSGFDSAGENNPRVSGHRDWESTACPGQLFYDTIGSLRSQLATTTAKYAAGRKNLTGCPPGFLEQGGNCKGTQTTSYSTSSNRIVALASRSSTLLGLETTSNQLVRINSDGSRTNLATLGAEPRDLIVASDNTTYALTSSSIKRINTSNEVSNLADLSGNPTEITMDSQNLYVSDATNNLVRKVTLAAGTVTTLGTTGGSPRGIAFTNGAVYTANYNGNSVTKITTAGSATAIKITGENPLAITTDDAGNLYTANYGTHDVTKVGPDNGVAKLGVVGRNPVDIAYMSGSLYVLHQGGTVSQVGLTGETEEFNLNQPNATDIWPHAGSVFAAVNSGQQVSRLATNSTTIPATLRISRFWSAQQQSHFFTGKNSERNQLIQYQPDDVWKYERTAFHAPESAQNGAQEVYRFWSPLYRTHFYTINPQEKANLQASAGDVWNYEGVTYFAYRSQASLTAPLFRFWSTTRKRHFYTTSAAERDNLINNYLDDVWRYEGIAYYVYL